MYKAHFYSRSSGRVLGRYVLVATCTIYILVDSISSGLGVLSTVGGLIFRSVCIHLHIYQLMP